MNVFQVSLMSICEYLSEHTLDRLEVSDVHYVNFSWDELLSSPYNKWFSIMVLTGVVDP
ncbi:hypothetical protein VP01_15588g1 [Puccinia sorghi]|uniref:Uncharacterized protein n=1 Tax=Puccinia sorghi TaxID=27349 RepID=A0A0L6VI37_9BASI|nr:hypothetical protein VP01_15588g1 [Puccinia sorghi]